MKQWLNFQSRFLFFPLIVLSTLFNHVIISGADWPQYRGANSDNISTESILLSWPATGPTKKWTISSLTNGFSTFAISRGLAVSQCWRAQDSGNLEYCVGLDAKTGAEVWSTVVGQALYPQTGAGPDDGPRSTPSIIGDKVLILNTYLSLLCLNITDGSILWSNNLLTVYGGKLIPWQNAASPAVDGDLVFVSTCASTSNLMAIRIRDGSLVWRSQKEKATHATPTVTTLHGRRQVIFATQSGYVSLDRNTGELLWKYPYPFICPPSLAVSPVVHQNMIFCSAGYGVGSAVAKVLENNGAYSVEQLWANTKLQSQWMTPVCHNGYIYGLFSAGDPRGPLKCLDMATGQQLWSVNGFGMGGLILVNNHLLILKEAGQLVLAKADPSAYAEVARYQVVNGKCWNHPVLSGGRIYTRSTTEAVCLDVSDPSQDTAPALKLLIHKRTDAGLIQLAISTTDGSPLDAARAATIEVMACPGNVKEWHTLTNISYWSGGMLWLNDVNCVQSPNLFFIAREQR